LLKPGKRFAVALVNVATFHKPIREGVLAASQFPPELTDEADALLVVAVVAGAADRASPVMVRVP
jgi:hypothetical protein